MSANSKSSIEMLNDAGSQIDDLERDVMRFFKSNPYSRVIEQNTDNGADTHKIKLSREIPGQFRSKTRHIASDIRSSLDHICYAASIATGKVKPRKTYFPFARSESEIDNVRKNRCADFPQEIFDILWGFKPYLGGDETLWSLNEIANCNKHRSIVPVGHGLAGNQMMANFSCDGLCHEMAFPPVWDAIKNEAILCVVDSAANTNYNIQIRFDICFGDIDIVRNAPVLGVLRTLHRTAKTIISAADAEGVRIGIFN